MLIIRMYARVNRNPVHYFFSLFVIYFIEACSLFSLSFLCIHCHVSTIQIKSLAACLGIAGHGLMHPCMHCTFTQACLFISGSYNSYGTTVYCNFTLPCTSKLIIVLTIIIELLVWCHYVAHNMDL